MDGQHLVLDFPGTRWQILAMHLRRTFIFILGFWLGGLVNGGIARTEQEPRPFALELIDNSRMPSCPAGGKYAYNVAGKNATCSVHGHKYR
tara:strand:+ start:4015 stop:4287 length:273 start_codon:yes stop_codon:yes gene_type:complete